MRVANQTQLSGSVGKELIIETKPFCLHFFRSYTHFETSANSKNSSSDNAKPVSDKGLYCLITKKFIYGIAFVLFLAVLENSVLPMG